MDILDNKGSLARDLVDNIKTSHKQALNLTHVESKIDLGHVHTTKPQVNESTSCDQLEHIKADLTHTVSSVKPATVRESNVQKIVFDSYSARGNYTEVYKMVDCLRNIQIIKENIHAKVMNDPYYSRGNCNCDFYNLLSAVSQGSVASYPGEFENLADMQFETITDVDGNLCQRNLTDLYSILSNVTGESFKTHDEMDFKANPSFCQCALVSVPTQHNSQDIVHGSNNVNEIRSEIEHVDRFPLPHSAGTNTRECNANIPNLERCLIDKANHNTLGTTSVPGKDGNTPVCDVDSCSTKETSTHLNCANMNNLPNITDDTTISAIHSVVGSTRNNEQENMSTTDDKQFMDGTEETDRSSRRRKRLVKKRGETVVNRCLTDDETDDEASDSSDVTVVADVFCDRLHTPIKTELVGCELSADSAVESQGNDVKKAALGSETSIHSSHDSGHCSLNSESSAASLNNSSVEDLTDTFNVSQATFVIGDNSSCEDLVPTQKQSRVSFQIGCDSDSDEEDDTNWGFASTYNQQDDSRVTFFVGDDDYDSDFIDDDFSSYNPMNNFNGYRTQEKADTEESWDSFGLKYSHGSTSSQSKETQVPNKRILPKSSSNPDLVPRDSLSALNFLWNIKISKSAPTKLNASGTKKRVSFAEGKAFLTVFEIESTPESDESRKGPWEAYALDRFRFEQTIDEIDCMIGWCLDVDHRQRIYNNRSRLSIIDS